MKILVKGNTIYAIAENISYGKYEDEEKWRLADANDNILYYMIDYGFTLVEDVEIPSDYEDGKYFYENGEFILNAEWKPYVSMEDRMAELEAQNEMLMSCLLEMSEIVYA